MLNYQNTAQFLLTEKETYSIRLQSLQKLLMASFTVYLNRENGNDAVYICDFFSVTKLIKNCNCYLF